MLYFLLFQVQCLNATNISSLNNEKTLKATFTNITLCEEIYKWNPSSSSKTIYISNSDGANFILDESCFPYQEPYVDLSNSGSSYKLTIESFYSSYSYGLTLKLDEKRRIQNLIIGQGIRLTLIAEKLTLKTLDTSASTSVTAHTVDLKVRRLVAKWDDVANFKRIEFVEASLTGLLTSSATGKLHQVLNYFSTNSFEATFTQDSEVQFDRNNNQLRVLTSVSSATISLPSSYNFSCSFEFHINALNDFKISGDIAYSSKHKNSISIGFTGSSYSSNKKIILGPGNYPELGLYYSQRYGELTIENDHNFTGISLINIEKFTPLTTIKTTGEFSIETTTNSISEFMIQNEFRLSCYSFSSSGFRRIYAIKDFKISIELFEVSIEYDNNDPNDEVFYLEIERSYLTIWGDECKTFSIGCNLSITDLNVPNSLLLSRRDSDSKTFIRTNTLSGKGTIYLNDLNGLRKIEEEILFTPFIQILQNANIKRFALYNADLCQCQLLNTQNPQFQSLSISSFYNVTQLPISDEEFVGIHQIGNPRQFSYLYNSGTITQSFYTFGYYIYKNQNDLKQYCPFYDNQGLYEDFKVQCDVNGANFNNLTKAGIIRNYYRTIYIYTSVDTEIDLSYIDHDVQIYFYNLNYDSSDSSDLKTIRITKLPSNHHFILQMTISGCKVVIEPSFDFYGTSLTITNNGVLEPLQSLTIRCLRISIENSRSFASRKRITITGADTYLTFRSTLENLTELIESDDSVRFPDKATTIEIYHDTYSPYEKITKIEFGSEWTYSTRLKEDDYLEEDERKDLSFKSKSNLYPTLVIPFFSNCTFELKNSASLSNTILKLKGGSTYYEDEIIENDEVVHYTFKGFSSLAEFPFYFYADNNDNNQFEITILDNDKQDNILPINIFPNEKYGISVTTSLSIYIDIPDQYHELIFNKYVYLYNGLTLHVAKRKISTSTLTYAVFKNFVSVSSISSELTVHFQNYFRCTNSFPTHYIIQNDNKVVDINTTTTLPFSSSKGWHDHTLNIHITGIFLLNFLQQSDNLFNNYISFSSFTQWSRVPPKINFIFENNKNQKLTDLLQHYGPIYRSNQKKCYYRSPEDFEKKAFKPLIYHTYSYLNLLADRVSLKGSNQMEFQDKIIEFQTYTDFKYNHAYYLDNLDPEVQYRKAFGSSSERNFLFNDGTSSQVFFGIYIDKISDVSSGLAGWAIALIVIACVIVVAAIAILLTLFLLKRKSAGKAARSSQGQDPSSQEHEIEDQNANEDASA